MAGGSASVESRLLALVGDIQGLLDLDEFREGLIIALRRTVGCDWVSLNEFGPGPQDVWSLVVPPLSDEIVDLFARYAHENPLLRYAQRTQDGRPRRISDEISREAFHALDLYREVYSLIGLEYQMAFMLPHEPPRLLGVALNRRDRDFTDEERDLVDRARPFLIQGYRNAVEHTGLRRAGAGGAMLSALQAAGLSPREAEAVRLVALGRSNADAADELGLSVRTVHKHLEHAFPKLDVHTRSDASAKAWVLAAQDGAGETVRRRVPSS
jgi:DNA-binding CsgD family transcriptional regulator